jgi:hypothetical protein
VADAGNRHDPVGDAHGDRRPGGYRPAGPLLAEALARGLALPLIELTNIHLAWGLGGWALMLLAGVSYHVVPMFQLTRPYPLWFTRGFGPCCCCCWLLAWSAQFAWR